MSVISLEFSVWENDLCLRNAAFEIGNEAKKSENPDIKIENIPGKTFLHMLYQRKPIKMRSSTGHEISLSADEIMQSFCNGEDDWLYLIIAADNQIRAVWEHYDEEEIYRRYYVRDICRIQKIEALIAADEELIVDAESLTFPGNIRQVNGSEILALYEGDRSDRDVDDDYFEDCPPSFCPHPGMCYNYMDDRDMCDKCGGF